jgi:hypothetical protein
MSKNAAPCRSYAESHLCPKALEQEVNFSQSASRAIVCVAFFDPCWKMHQLTDGARARALASRLWGKLQILPKGLQEQSIRLHLGQHVGNAVSDRSHTKSHSCYKVLEQVVDFSQSASRAIL